MVATCGWRRVGVVRLCQPGRCRDVWSMTSVLPLLLRVSPLRSQSRLRTAEPLPQRRVGVVRVCQPVSRYKGRAVNRLIAFAARFSYLSAQCGYFFCVVFASFQLASLALFF